MNKSEVFIALFTEIHCELLKTVTTSFEEFIIPEHHRLYVCAIVVYRQRLVPWSDFSLYLIVVVETFSCYRETITCSSEQDPPGSVKLLTADIPSVLASSGTVSQYGRRAQWFGLLWLSRTIVWPYWNLAVGWRQFQCNHFLLALCDNYCVTRLQLHCIIPTYSLSTATHAHSCPTSHTISGRDWNLGLLFG